MHPNKLGLPCWAPERIKDVVTGIAKMDAARSHYFLASHSPIAGAYDEKSKRQLDEAGLFQSIFDGTRSESVAVVWGEPGCGKSHLIHWLKLRADYAISVGELKQVRPVLIQRRTGSLKDALTQLLEQLPVEFEKHLDPVRHALEQIDKATAREILAQKLFIELGTERRKARSLPPLERELRDIRELCAAQGTRSWLCRDDGVIDAWTRRLAGKEEGSSAGKTIEFTVAEFVGIAPKYRNGNGDAVTEIYDLLDFEGEVAAKKVTQHFNEALPHALREMSGLGGTTLQDVFNGIRKQLHDSGQGLALFIEDVSVMAELDTEVFRAVEPQGRAELGRLVAVLGMTDRAKGRLRDNELGRLSHLVQMKGSVENWAESEESVAAFAARYLNALRLPESDLKQIAEHRRTGADVHISGCAGCPWQETCHQAFGAVTFEGQAVGLFPLSKVAPVKLLQGLEATGGVRQNQRGFLDNVLRKVLAQGDLLKEGAFPGAVHLGVTLPEPNYWGPFVERRCFTWRRDDSARLRVLAQGWTRASSDEGYLEALGPMLQPLGFPPFAEDSRTVPAPSRDAAGGGSRKPAKERKDEVGGKVSPPPEFKKPAPQKQDPANPGPSKALQGLLDDLARWESTGAPLQRDQHPRDLLKRFLITSLPLEHTTRLPQEVWKRHLENKATIHIDGQLSAPANVTLRLRFERSKETRDLIEALARFEDAKDSWDFEHGENYKRTVSRWLRKRGAATIQALQPKDIDLSAPVRSGVSLLALGAVLRSRRSLPEDPVRLVEELLTPMETEPAVVDPQGTWAGALRLLRQEIDQIRRFVVSETGLPQGRSPGINFIDPRLLLEAGTAFASRTEVVQPPAEAMTGPHAVRYRALNAADVFSDMTSQLEAERSSLRDTIRQVRGVLRQNQCDEESLEVGVSEFVSHVVLLLKTQNEEQFPVPDNDVQRWRPRLSELAAWSSGAAQAASASESRSIREVLLVDPAPAAMLASFLGAIAAYVSKVEDALSKADRGTEQTQGEDPLALHQTLVRNLERFEALSKKVVTEVGR
jgi:hypothetical protein